MPRRVTRPKVKTGRVGRPGGQTRYLIQWAIDTAENVQEQQIAKDRVASGQSLESWEVDIRDKNNLDLKGADYYSFLISEKIPMGRAPTKNMGDGAVMRAIRRWIPQKGIKPTSGTMENLLYAITRSIHNLGTSLYKSQSKTTAISINDAIEVASSSAKLDKIALEIAEESANKLLQNFIANPKFKVR